MKAKMLIAALLPLFLWSCAPSILDIEDDDIVRVEVGPAWIDFDFASGQIIAQNQIAERIRVQVKRCEFNTNYIIFDHRIRRYPDRVCQLCYIRTGVTYQVNVYHRGDVYSDSFKFR